MTRNGICGLLYFTYGLMGYLRWGCVALRCADEHVVVVRAFKLSVQRVVAGKNVKN